MKFLEVDWGETDASDYAKPADFVRTFVDLPQMDLLLTERFCIITGEKGAGKTALRIKMESLVQSEHFGPANIATIDFKTGDFETFENDLDKLSRHTQIAPQRLLRNYWEFLIVLESVKAVRRTDAAFAEKIDIQSLDPYTRKLLQESQLSGPSTTLLGDYMRGLIERAWRIFEGTRQDMDSRAQAVTDVLCFPLAGNEYRNLWDQLRDHLRLSGKRMFVFLDGFDRFYGLSDAENSKSDSTDTRGGSVLHLRHVFDSLLDAVLLVTTSPIFQRLLVIKASIPHDRMVVSRLRDLDKLRARQLRIRWDPEKLQELVRVRINESLRADYREFSTAWRAVMPARVRNRTYGCEEATLDYLLRHTMWRPRQLQSHLRRINSMYQQATRGTFLEAIIEKAVRESCDSLVVDFIQEYIVDHPNLRNLLARFRTQTNIMRFKNFSKLIRNCAIDYDGRQWTEAEKLRLLFKMGFFGVIEPVDPKRADSHALWSRNGGAPYRCQFFYKIGEPQPGFPQLTDTDEIAIHPIFFDYCQMKADPNRIVG